MTRGSSSVTFPGCQTRVGRVGSKSEQAKSEQFTVEDAEERRGTNVFSAFLCVLYGELFRFWLF